MVAPHRALLAEVVGQTATALNRNTFLEATMDNLLLQAVAEVAETHIAFSNGWRYGAPIPADPVTAAHVAKVLGICDPSDVAPSSRCSRSGSNAASSSAPPRRSRSTSGARAGRTWPTKATG